MSEPYSARASATKWETYVEDKAMSMLTRMIEARIDFSYDRITEQGDRNDVLVKHTFFFPADKLIEHLAGKTM